MIKKNIIKYRTSKNERNRKTDAQVDFSACKTIGMIIHEHFENEENINHLVEQLKISGKSVSKIYFLKKPAGHLMSPWFKPSQINIFGQIKSPELDHFIRKKYDFLLCLDETNNYLLDYVASISIATSRIGIMQPERANIYEMMIQAGENGFASRELLKYLKMIRTNER